MATNKVKVVNIVETEAVKNVSRQISPERAKQPTERLKAEKAWFHELAHETRLCSHSANLRQGV